MTNEITILDNNIIIKEYNGERVVTAYDIAKLHTRDVREVNQQFKRNIERFEENNDYYIVDKNYFKENLESECDYIPNNVLNIVLFTETAYLLLIKTFKDEISWDIQKHLIKKYFKFNELIDKIKRGELIIENKNTADKEKINILMKTAELTTDDTLKNNILSEIVLITTGKRLVTSENTIDYDTELKLAEIERIRNTPIEELLEEENKKFMEKIENYPAYAKNKILIFPDHNNNITILDYIKPNSYSDSEIANVMKNAYGINISRKSLNSFCEKFQLKTNDYGYVYYNPDKKSADFRYYMEIADKLLKCLCNYPYTRKKYNLSLSFYDEHSKNK
jgi:hypothetical protein